MLTKRKDHATRYICYDNDTVYCKIVIVRGISGRELGFVKY